MHHPTHRSAANTRSRRPPPRGAKPSRARSRRKPAVAPRVTVGAALCRAGLDELALGKRWLRIIRNLSRIEHRKNTAVQKLLFDVLKECTRQLDSDHEQQRAANVVVQLVHAVPRPPVRQAGPPRVAAVLPGPNPPADGVAVGA